MSRSDDLRATEKWFYRRGLPFFVEDYRSSTDVWTRASPFLAVTFLVLMVTAAISFEDAAGAWAGIALAVALAAAYVVWNLRRGSRWNAIPERVTWPVLAGFVLVPAVVTLASSRTLDAVVGAVVLGLVILLVSWVVTRYAVLPLVGWAVRYTFHGLGDLYRLATRALPLMLLLITFLFISTEVWQVAGTLDAGRLWAVIGLFGLLGIAFILGRVPAEIRLIEAESSAARVVVACEGTPLAERARTLDGLQTPVPLNRRQWANIGLVMAVAQLVQVALFAVVVWAFFVLFGALAMSVRLQEMWLAGLTDVDVTWAWGAGHGVTRPLLRVATFLAAFSGFYVTIYAGVDAAYREHFYDRIREDLERSLSVRRAYLAFRRGPGRAP